jgi:hypothetical protein
MPYTVSAIPLAPVPDFHDGTGFHEGAHWFVDPSTVPGSNPLKFYGAWAQVTTLLFALDDDNAVPNWFGVAVPSGIQDFTRAHLFFHPMPAQAGYVDADYKTKSGLWPQLFYYMERLGYQVDAAHRSQILIMPFLTNAATDTGILPANWLDICTQILTLVRAAAGADDGSPLQLAELVVSSFSVGIVYSNSFRKHAANVDDFLTEVWDFDGLFSTEAELSTELISTPTCTAIKYDQNPASGPSSFHVPLPRWADYVAAPTAPGQVHGLIRDFMFFHAATISGVGATIDPNAPSPVATPTSAEPPPPMLGVPAWAVGAIPPVVVPMQTGPMRPPLSSALVPPPIIVPQGTPSWIPSPLPFPVPATAPPPFGPRPQIFPPMSPTAPEAGTISTALRSNTAAQPTIRTHETQGCNSSAVAGMIAVVASTAITAVTAVMSIAGKKRC